MAELTTVEGTGHELLHVLAKFPNEHFPLIPLPEGAHKRHPNRAADRPSEMGKHPYVPGGSEEFAAEKQAEVDLEYRARE